MRDDIYNETIIEFEKKRTLKEINQNKRKQEMYKSYPRLEEIANQLNYMGIELAKSISTGPSNMNGIKTFEKKTQELVEERTQILVNAGYAKDYLEIEYDCPACHDMGIIEQNTCSCFTKALIRKYYQQSNLDKVLSIENFDTFRLDCYDEDKSKFGVSPRLNIQNIYLMAVNFVEKFDSQYENLYLYGNSGLGKTFISHCIAKELLDKGKSVIYQTATDLIDSIRRNKFNQNIQVNTLSYLYQCDLLIIDDLGTESLTEFANNELFNLLNRRLMDQKSTVISTNSSLKELQKRYSTRLTSRIIGNFTFLKFIGDDIRLKKAKLL